MQYVDFAVPADHRIKLKECEKKDKYLNLARELKKLWNMKVAIIPIVTGAFSTVPKELLKGLEDLEVSRHFCMGIYNCLILLKIQYVIAIHVMR